MEMIGRGTKNKSGAGSAGMGHEGGAGHSTIIKGRPGTSSTTRAGGPDQQHQVKRGMIARTAKASK